MSSNLTVSATNLFAGNIRRQVLYFMLKIEETVWQYVKVPEGQEIGQVEILFERIDKKVVQEEESHLLNMKHRMIQNKK